MSAFAHPDLDGVLESAVGSGAYMIGFSAPMSLTATLFDAEDRGQNLMLVEEAIGSADVSEWSAEESRELCINTARQMNRAVSLNELRKRLHMPGAVAAESA